MWAGVFLGPLKKGVFTPFVPGAPLRGFLHASRNKCEGLLKRGSPLERVLSPKGPLEIPPGRP